MLSRELRWPGNEHAGLNGGRFGFKPWPGHRVVFLGKSLYYNSGFLSNQGYKMVPVNFQGSPMKCWGRLPVIVPVSHCLTYNSMVKELKSMLESSYPSSWSSSLFS